MKYKMMLRMSMFQLYGSYQYTYMLVSVYECVPEGKKCT